MRAMKWVGGLVLLAVVASGIVYARDPWLWRNYRNMLKPGVTNAEEGMPADEEIRGDGSFVLPVAAPEDRTVSAAALKAAEDYARAFDSHALIVVHKGVIQDEWYNDYWSAEKFTQSQSMHKTLMGLFVGIAIDDGKIASADDPVGKYLTEWKNDPRGRITLRQLMQMSSGLDPGTFSPNPYSFGMQWLNSGHSERVVLSTPLAGWAPGTKYQYNNLNSELLGIVLVRVYGQRYAELLRAKLWLPMGGQAARVHTDAPGGRAYTSCCLGAPAMDWARFGMMLLGRGEVNGHRIVSESWIAEMIAPSPNAPHYGLQIWLGYNDPPFPGGQAGSTGGVATEPFLARDTFMTIGRGQQHVFVVPSQDLVIVRMGPALGRNPIKPGFDIPRLVNTIVRGLGPR